MSNHSTETLTIQFSYTFGEESSSRSLYLVNRSAFLLPSSVSQGGGFFTLFCIGLLGDSGTEMTADTVNTSVGFRNSMYVVSSKQIDNSGDFIAITFLQFLFSFSGNFTCCSTLSGSERTVFISGK